MNSLITALTIKQVYDTLRAAKWGHSLPASPLKYLYLWSSVYKKKSSRRQMDVSPEFLDAVLTEWLNECIVFCLAKHRTYFGLGRPDINADYAQVLDEFRDDFMQNSPVLEGWSMLYVWYVRVELPSAFRLKDLVQKSTYDGRTLRRRTHEGIKQLHRHLIVQELEYMAQSG